MVCSGCKQDKADTAFGWKNKARGVRHGFCRDCKSVYNRRWYEKHKDEQKARAKKNSARYRQRNRVAVLAYLKEHPCVDCSEADPVVLQFDHVSGEKVTDVGTMLKNGRPWAVIEAEIEKCEVVCANCHRRRTHTRIRSSSGRTPLS